MGRPVVKLVSALTRDVLVSSFISFFSSSNLNLPSPSPPVHLLHALLLVPNHSACWDHSHCRCSITAYPPKVASKHHPDTKTKSCFLEGTRLPQPPPTQHLSMGGSLRSSVPRKAPPWWPVCLGLMMCKDGRLASQLLNNGAPKDSAKPLGNSVSSLMMLSKRKYTRQSKIQDDD